MGLKLLRLGIYIKIILIVIMRGLVLLWLVKLRKLIGFLSYLLGKPLLRLRVRVLRYLRLLELAIRVLIIVREL